MDSSSSPDPITVFESSPVKSVQRQVTPKSVKKSPLKAVYIELESDRPLERQEIIRSARKIKRQIMDFDPDMTNVTARRPRSRSRTASPHRSLRLGSPRSARKSDNNESPLQNIGHFTKNTKLSIPFSPEALKSDELLSELSPSFVQSIIESSNTTNNGTNDEHVYRGDIYDITRHAVNNFRHEGSNGQHFDTIDHQVVNNDQHVGSNFHDVASNISPIANPVSQLSPSNYSNKRRKIGTPLEERSPLIPVFVPPCGDNINSLATEMSYDEPLKGGESFTIHSDVGNSIEITDNAKQHTPFRRIAFPSSTLDSEPLFGSEFPAPPYPVFEADTADQNTNEHIICDNKSSKVAARMESDSLVVHVPDSPMKPLSTEVKLPPVVLSPPSAGVNMATIFQPRLTQSFTSSTNNVSTDIVESTRTWCVNDWKNLEKCIPSNLKRPMAPKNAIRNARTIAKKFTKHNNTFPPSEVIDRCAILLCR